MPLQFAKRPPIAPKLLLWYMRLLATFYFVSGLGHWGFLVGATGPGFELATPHVQVATVYFAIIEVMAAVGLWFGAAWGVAAWLFAITAALIMHLGFADLFGPAWAMLAFHVTTLLVYLCLAWWSGAPENTSEVLRLPPE